MERTIDVWYEKTGRIVAWGHIPSGASMPLRAMPLAGQEHQVITAQVAANNLLKLNETHYVEPNAKRLVRRKTG